MVKRQAIGGGIPQIQTVLRRHKLGRCIDDAQHAAHDRQFVNIRAARVEIMLV
jgi:hypothetical protein